MWRAVARLAPPLVTATTVDSGDLSDWAHTRCGEGVTSGARPHRRDRLAGEPGRGRPVRRRGRHAASGPRSRHPRGRATAGPGAVCGCAGPGPRPPVPGVGRPSRGPAGVGADRAAVAGPHGSPRCPPLTALHAPAGVGGAPSAAPRGHPPRRDVLQRPRAPSRREGPVLPDLDRDLGPPRRRAHRAQRGDRGRGAPLHAYRPGPVQRDPARRRPRPVPPADAGRGHRAARMARDRPGTGLRRLPRDPRAPQERAGPRAGVLPGVRRRCRPAGAGARRRGRLGRRHRPGARGGARPAARPATGVRPRRAGPGAPRRRGRRRLPRLRRGVRAPGARGDGVRGRGPHDRPALALGGRRRGGPVCAEPGRRRPRRRADRAAVRPGRAAAPRGGGLARAAAYTWDATARLHEQVYESVVGR